MIELKDLEYNLVDEPIAINKSGGVATTVSTRNKPKGEYFGAKGEHATMYSYSSSHGSELCDEVYRVFGIDLRKFTKSQSLQHESKNNIITVFPTVDEVALIDGNIQEGLVYVTIKFDLNKSQAYFKYIMMMQAFVDDKHPELPSGSWIGGWAYYRDFDGYDFPQDFVDRQDLFYSNESVEVVGDFYNITVRKAKFRNFYGIHYDKNTLEVLKSKIYVFDNKDSSVAYWFDDLSYAESRSRNRQLVDRTLRLTPRQISL
jgi:hypothetical protein